VACAGRDLAQERVDEQRRERGRIQDRAFGDAGPAMNAQRYTHLTDGQAEQRS